MESICHIPKHERHYYAQCETCHSYFDCRDLSQVLEHTHQNIQHASFTISHKRGEHSEYLKGKIPVGRN